MKIRKAQGNSGVGIYWWPFDGAVIHVDGELGNYLLAMPPSAGFTNADNDVMEKVPDDKVFVVFNWAAGSRERALAALQVEEAKGYQQRAYLVKRLKKLVNATDAELAAAAGEKLDEDADDE